MTKVNKFSNAENAKKNSNNGQRGQNGSWALIVAFWRAGEPEPGVFGSLEPEPAEKKTVAGAAPKKKQEPEPPKFSSRNYLGSRSR